MTPYLTRRSVLAGIGLVGAGFSFFSGLNYSHSVPTDHHGFDRMTLHLEGEAVDYHDGAYARIDLAALLNAPDEIALRLISRVLSRMGGQAHPPRLSKMEELAARLSDGGGKQWSSAGCLVCRGDAGIEVYRETGRRGLPEIVLAPGESSIWDRRFKVAAHVDCGGV